MRILKKLSLVLLVVIFLLIPLKASALSTEDKLNQLREQIEQYEREISRLRSQANTLSNQIAQFDAQIRWKDRSIRGFFGGADKSFFQPCF